MATVNKEKKSTFKKVFDIVTNVLYAIVMIILIIFLVYGFGSLSNNRVPSFFGQSYVRILSGSMEESGFERGDVVVIKKVNISTIEEGDIIAFYNNYTTTPALLTAEQASDIEISDFKTGRSSFSSSIIFHKIEDVRYDADGNTYFRTYGTSNVNADGSYRYDGWIRGDRVVGVYTESGLAGFIQFMSSSTGIIVLVVVPSCIVLLILAFSIIDTIDKMIKQKKLEKEMIDENIKETNLKNEENENTSSTDDKEGK